MRALACCALVATAAAAQQERVVVTATRIPQPGFDIPAAIDAVDAERIREDNPQVNLSEALGLVPGLVVQNRQNYAQDLQISSRGFGARAAFGVRGVRLIADGIPATMPDGQGQAATFDLASAGRIEILRGPFTSLYGNASGGVVQVFTADAPARPTADLGFHAGSFGMRRGSLRFGGEAGPVGFLGAASRFETDGYRRHSAAVREQWNAKGRLALARGTFTLVASGLDQPGTQDPLGLTRAQFEDDPRQADAAAFTFDTRKSIRQSQAGGVYEADLGRAGRISARLYGGDRAVVQYLALPGDGVLASGGVVDLDRTYGGVGLRWSTSLAAAARPLTLTIGVEHDRMEERRRGFVNDFGVAGALRRDEDDEVANTDVFAQAEWEWSPRWSLHAGARRSTVRFVSRDRYFTPANPDDSGRVEHSRTTPVAGIVYKPSERLRLYANAGEGFETPTFAELAYRPGGATGLNFALQPAKSRHYEAGMKARLANGLRANAALFRIETRGEIVTNASSGGRTDFRNASRTLRRGLELALEGRFARGLEAHLAYTLLDARFVEGFETAAAAIGAGRRLPGVPRTVLQAEAAWRPAPRGFHAAVELRHAAKVYVNEANTDAAPAYTVVNLRAGLEQHAGPWRFREFVRVDNVADRKYAGSVIVAEARGRFFEPAPGRNHVVGIEASYTF